MPQKIFVSDVTITDTTIPKLRDDALLSDGSLFLFDPSHSLGGFSGIPTSGTVPNVAWKEAALVLGSGTQSTLAASMLNASADTANVWKTERTSAGGIHGIVTQAGGQTIGKSWYAKAPQAVADYLRTNASTHQFYFSIWKTITRPTVAAGNVAPQSHFNMLFDTSNFLFHFSNGFATPSAAGSIGTTLVPNAADSAVAVGTPKFASVGTNNKNGTLNPGQGVTFGVGTFDAFDAYNWNKAPSVILYRLYIEDLTASGRSYATVQALDQALYTAAFASGGRFYNDTYTNPSTLP